MRPWRARAGTAACMCLAALAALGTTEDAFAQERRQPRIIAPELFAPPPVDPSGLERTEPRAPLSELGQPAPEPGPVDTLYHQPIAIAAGLLQAEGRTIRIAGIRIISPDQVCDASSGAVWPCGKRARTAFRYWLRGRAVECHAQDPQENNAADQVAEMTMVCRLAGRDVGAWLVENGWALADADGPYPDKEKTARIAGKGIFGGGPSGL
ncbi:thermonuclease family protein [Nitratireductor sp. GISD-1A_MAKvit]|uniref:thermonuclease family protein n=1 Tax=Nitratireductor sp. GISD-1A_MAKvit TaxID=3234198 RepID=UPI003467E945